jgi:predicted Zn-dependent protease
VTPLLVLPLLLAGGCAVNPVTGRTEIILMSERDEDRIGKQEADRVAAEIGLVEDPELLQLVDAVGRRVARQSPRLAVDYRFQVVDMAEPNAFALPGGYVYVSRGLLAISNSEEELANVIGHEIAHVAARHSAQRQTAATGVGLLTVLGGIVGSVLGAPGANLATPMGMAGQAIIAGYSREQEREADEVGQEMAARAGVDPHGMPAFLRTLENTERLRHGASRRPSFADTHPATPERVARTTARAESLRWTRQAGVTENRRAYLLRLDGLLLGENPSEGVFHERRFFHADLDLTIRFPEGWNASNSRFAVGAVTPNREAQVTLETQGRAGDPRAAAGAFLQQLAREGEVRVIDSEALQIGTLPAFHAETLVGSNQGTVAADFTWVSHGNLMYRISGVAPQNPYRRYRGLFRNVARSFRPLEPDERELIQETRLRVVEAAEDETLAELSARTHNTWDLNRTAVANGLFIDSRLRAGRLVKVAVQQPYVPPTD